MNKQATPAVLLVDRVNAWLGKATSWLALIMVLVGAYNAVARYLGRSLGVNLSSNAYIELQWYLFSAVFLLGAAYTLQANRHVRVDVIYARLSSRARAWINLAGSVLFLVPFCAFLVYVSWPWVRNSWLVMEGSPDPDGLPRYPVKTIILVGFTLLLFQGLAEVVRAIVALRQASRDEDPA